jgi:hypothetical protein
MNNNLLGINFGFVETKFFVEYSSCLRPVGNLKEEFAQRARELFCYNKNLILGISSGLDSQAVMHSFCSQGLHIKYAFLHMPGYNDFEFNNLQILAKKYSIDPIIIKIDPIEIRDGLMHEYETTGTLPSHAMQAKFLKMLPKDHDIIQGIHGPDFLFSKNNWYLLETANSIEISRLRAFQQVERTGKVIGWERTAEITASLLTDDVVTAFMSSYNYISAHELVYKNGNEIPIIDHWDLYIKPFIYGKYWKDELEYFPKRTGFESLDWIENGPRHNYRKNLIKVPYQKLVDHLTSINSETLRFYES